MNGDALEKLKAEVKRMKVDEWRGYLAAKVETVQENQKELKAELSATKTELSNLKTEVAKLPAHCVHEDDFIKMCNIEGEIDGRLGALEQEQTGRKAIRNLLLGAGGGIGILGGTLAILKLVFEVF